MANDTANNATPPGNTSSAITNVVVPLDGSHLSSTALGIGAEVAQLTGADLRVIAYTREHDKPSIAPQVLSQVEDAGRRFGVEPHLTISEMKKFVARHLQDEVSTRSGSLVCMASHGRGRSAAYYGSVAEEVVGSSLGPVLIIGPELQVDHYQLAERGPIIVAVDGTDDSESILSVAEEWSVRFGLPLEVVTVLPVEIPGDLAASLASGDVVESGYVQQTASSTEAFTAEVADFEVLHDNHPAHAIVNEAKIRNASMIAMATHNRTGVARLRRGSVTAEVIRHSTVPVLALQRPESAVS